MQAREAESAEYSTRWRHNLQADPSTWRALDLWVWRVVVRSWLRRLSCPAHGVVVEAVPFARHGARFTRDVDDLVAWPAEIFARVARHHLIDDGRVVQTFEPTLAPLQLQVLALLDLAASVYGSTP